MTSLTDVYEGRVGRVATRRQQLLGSGLFLAGAAMVVAAIAFATTGVGAAVGLDTYGARELAGVLAGLGLPAVLLGVFAVLPASGRTRGAAVIGTSVAVFGVALFTYAYPYSWVTAAPVLALVTTVVYFAGGATALWCLFVALATFETRSDPGGTATMAVTESGTIRLVEEARSFPGFGSVGLFGNDPDGTVETQTNRSEKTEAEVATANGDSAEGAHTTSGSDPWDGESDRGPANDRTTTAAPEEPLGSTAPTADGGSAAVGDEPADGEFLDAAAQRGRPDAYCGNCAHFEYVRADGDITPYCSHHDELMEDMDACESWDGNN